MAETTSTLAVGETQPVTIELDESLPPGPWEARVSLASGLVERRARATITFPESGTASPVVVDAVPSPRPADLSWVPYAAAILAVVLATALVWLWRRRVRPTWA